MSGDLGRNEGSCPVRSGSHGLSGSQSSNLLQPWIYLPLPVVFQYVSRPTWCSLAKHSRTRPPFQQILDWIPPFSSRFGKRLALSRSCHVSIRCWGKPRRILHAYRGRRRKLVVVVPPAQLRTSRMVPFPGKVTGDVRGVHRDSARLAVVVWVFRDHGTGWCGVHGDEGFCYLYLVL